MPPASGLLHAKLVKSHYFLGVPFATGAMGGFAAAYGQAVLDSLFNRTVACIARWHNSQRWPWQCLRHASTRHEWRFCRRRAAGNNNSALIAKMDMRMPKRKL